ncbi:dTMP kinase [Haloglomus irregulare]|uniref:Probable thymidylate kinase n=1 Tax=Haloglomus irregulare TaxID=2234134 RepID=A0A554MY13_9EURY|nr:dTMP kinase [Haloglomus irregulare]TSD09999.1 dTMP kinase [Haloglomus irregulare]
MLITLEGIDGAGKSTVHEALRDHDALDGAVFTHEPTDSWYGEAVRRSLGDGDADPLAELFLYTADHADHLANVVRPALAEGRVVVSDRYVDSRYAYQGAALDGELDRPLEYVRGIHEAFTRSPDATLYLDVDPRSGAERAGASDKFETAGHLAAVQANYERLIEAEPERFVRIDATRPPEDVVAAAEGAIDRIIAGRG